MAIQHPDIQPAVNHSVQVAIAGAGGWADGELSRQMGIDVLVVEKLDKLIDYRVRLVLMTSAAHRSRSTQSMMFCHTLRRARCVFSKAAVCDIQPMTVNLAGALTPLFSRRSMR